MKRKEVSAMIQSMNFPLSAYCLQPFGGWEALAARVRALGLDGVEAIADPDDMAEGIPLSLVSGYHLTFYPDWLDFWRQDEKALLRKFGSWAEVEKVLPDYKQPLKWLKTEGQAIINRIQN